MCNITPEHMCNITLTTYADDFLKRERRKNTKFKQGCLTNLGVLYKELKYKLPFNGEVEECDMSLSLVKLERCEILELLIPKHIFNDKFMQDMGLQIGKEEANSRQASLRELANIGIKAGGFFSTGFKGERRRQHVYYERWRESGTLESCLVDEEPPLIQLEGDSYTIVDGWGRLLPMAALILEDIVFSPVEVYLAKSRKPFSC